MEAILNPALSKNSIQSKDAAELNHEKHPSCWLLTSELLMCYKITHLRKSFSFKRLEDGPQHSQGLLTP